VFHRFPALAERDFRIFWVGQLISLLGTWMQNTVQPYLAYQLTGQPLFLGVMGFANTLPSLLLTLPAGVWIERMNKRRVVLVMQAIMAAQALTLGVLALTGLLQPWHMIVLTFVLGAANAIEITARQVMIPTLVSRELLPNALAMNATAFNLARVLGPALAAPLLLLLDQTGEGWAFVLNALSYVVVIAGLSQVRAVEASRDAPTESALDAFRTGQSHIRHSAMLTMVIAMSAVVGLFGFTAAQQIPVVARDVLAQATDTAGSAAARNSAMVAAMGIGALGAALTLSLKRDIRRKGLILTIGQLVFGLSILASSFSRWLPLTLLCLALTGFGQVLALNLSNQLIQLTVPPGLRARVFSTYLWALQGVAPFGSLIVGGLAQTLGAPAAIGIAGAMCVLAPLLANLRSGAVRDYVDAPSR
jgi:MFS family permease